MSNSRLRTKSLRRLRSIIALSSDFASSVSRSSAAPPSREVQSVAGLATNLTTLRKKLVLLSFGSAMATVCGGLSPVPGRPKPDCAPSGPQAGCSAGAKRQAWGWSSSGVKGPLAVRALQSPNIFCLSSRRCCASSDSVAVGRASNRPRPIGSPVSSQKP